jgi:hypothetical protein
VFLRRFHENFQSFFDQFDFDLHTELFKHVESLFQLDSSFTLTQSNFKLSDKFPLQLHVLIKNRLFQIKNSPKSATPTSNAFPARICSNNLNFPFQNATSIIIPSLLIEGPECFVTLKAHQNKKSTTGFLFVRLSHLKDDKPSGSNRASYIFFYTIFAVIIALFIVLGCIWKGRIALPITQKQLENMDLDLIKTITNRSMLEAIADLTRDEMMEVERENIRVLEALGEGAFGLVKKAIIIKDGEKHQVAVKMLKSTEKKISIHSASNDSTYFHFQIAFQSTISSSSIRRSVS